jgi:acyl-CoA hydrolase
MTRSKPAKAISASEAAALVRSGDWVDYGAVLAQPPVFDQVLAERVGELRNVSIRACLSVRPRAVVEADPSREHFNYLN